MDPVNDAINYGKDIFWGLITIGIVVVLGVIAYFFFKKMYGTVAK